MPLSIDLEELFAFLHALYWAALALVLGFSIIGAFYWTDTLRSERKAGRGRHFGGM